MLKREKWNYPSFDPELHKSQTIFEVCESDNECTKNVKLFSFKANSEYTIKIHYLVYYLYEYYQYYEGNY